MSATSGNNRRKDQLLGEPHGTAANRLRKALLFKYVQLAGHDVCHRCGERIKSVDDLSIEHRTSWQLAADPSASFFNLDDITFSHLRCNVASSDRSRLVSSNTGKTHCKHGHPFDTVNTIQTPDGRRECRACLRERFRRMRALNPQYGRGPLEREVKPPDFQSGDAGSIPARATK